MRERISILVIFVLLITTGISNAQTKIYVWNFLNEERKQDKDTRRITDEFETQLNQYPQEYTVLERRNFSKVFEQQKSEKAILTLSDLKQYQSQLNTMKAEVVVLGEIDYHEPKKIYTLRVKFIKIESSVLIENEPLNIPAEIYKQDIIKLQELINIFVSKKIMGKKLSGNTKLVNLIKFGVRAGLNLANPFETKLENSKTLKMIPAYHVGGIVAFKLSKAFSLESGLLLSGKGAKLEESYTSGAIWCSSTISPLFLEMPLNLLYSFDLGHAKMCLFGGGYVGFGISGKIISESANDYGSVFGLYNESTDIRFGQAADSHLNPIDSGVNLGIGVDIKNFLFRAQSNLGISRMGLKNLDAEKIESSVLEFSIGYMFGRI